MELNSRLAVVSRYAHPDQFPTDVRGLFDEAEQCCVYSGCAWFINYLKTVGQAPDEYCFYVLRLNDRPVAALPLHFRKPDWIGRKRIEAIGNYYTPLYAPLLPEKDGEAALQFLLKAVKSDCPRFTSLRLAPMEHGNQCSSALLSVLHRLELRAFEYFAFGNWYMPIRGTADEYFASREGSVRNTIRRANRKFERAGGHVKLLLRPEELDEGIRAFVSVYERSWKRPEPFPDFIPGVMRMCAGKGWLRLAIAYRNEQPIAAQLWIVAHGRAEIFKLAHVEQEKSLSPGTILTEHLMRHVLDVDGVHEVDFLIGDDPYKKSWLNCRRERVGVIAYNPESFWGRIEWFKELISRQLKPRSNTTASVSISRT